MSIQLINIGFGNMVSANRIIAVISPESAPVKRVISEARDKGLLIDATYGRKTRCYHHRQQPCNLVGDTAGNSCKSV